MKQRLHVDTHPLNDHPAEAIHTGTAAQRVRYPVTPDGRYFVMRGRLRRCSNPSLNETRRAFLKDGLMKARRDIFHALRAGDDVARDAALQRLDDIKYALGERGPVWWRDGAPDWNQRPAHMTPYADWFSSLRDSV